MTDIRFGTDGWRGRVAEEYTFDNVRRCAQGFASYMLSQGKRGEELVVGHDQRFSGELFAAAVAEVLAANGFRVLLTKGATPTPVISHAILTFNQNRRRALADGVVITPSHNPPEDGGFKYNPPHGGPAGNEITQRIAERARTHIVKQALVVAP